MFILAISGRRWSDFYHFGACPLLMPRTKEFEKIKMMCKFFLSKPINNFAGGSLASHTKLLILLFRKLEFRSRQENNFSILQHRKNQ